MTKGYKHYKKTTYIKDRELALLLKAKGVKLKDICKVLDRSYGIVQILTTQTWEQHQAGKFKQKTEKVTAPITQPKPDQTTKILERLISIESKLDSALASKTVPNKQKWFENL